MSVSSRNFCWLRYLVGGKWMVATSCRSEARIEENSLQARDAHRHKHAQGTRLCCGSNSPTPRRRLPRPCSCPCVCVCARGCVLWIRVRLSVVFTNPSWISRSSSVASWAQRTQAVARRCPKPVSREAFVSRPGETNYMQSASQTQKTRAHGQASGGERVTVKQREGDAMESG